jgi:hypothetical protein
MASLSATKFTQMARPDNKYKYQSKNMATRLIKLVAAHQFKSDDI